ncbi:MAG TPA: chemotaxis protein CheD [Rectinemataceae bacterium]|nr:chemotaxis protein CheD [Rectinemataceae bacterium]
MRYSADHAGRIVVQPGGQFVTREKTVVSTLLGSCVAVCLYDESSGVSGMNHFLLAHHRYPRHLPMTASEAGRFGIHAMELLVNEMMKLGADRKRLKAKAFGGGHLFVSVCLDNFPCVGDVNRRFIKEYLALEGIPLVSEDLGGERGRVIYFHTDTHQVFRRYVRHGRLDTVLDEEHGLWESSIRSHEGPEAGEVTLFT